MKKIMKKIMIVLFVCVISGCATNNSYIMSYSQTKDVNSIQGSVKLKKGHEPVIAISENISLSIDILRSKKFEVIGYSSFNGRYEDYNNAITQAKAIEATHVLISLKHTGNETDKKIGPQTNALISGVVSGGSPGGTPLAGANIAPSISNNNKLFNQEAWYLVKSNRKHKVGIYYNDMTPEQRKQYERQTGVFVRVIIEDTPAFKANVLAGDLAIKLNGHQILNKTGFENMIKTIDPNATYAVLTVIRKGHIKDIKLLLNPLKNT